MTKLKDLLLPLLLVLSNGFLSYLINQLPDKKDLGLSSPVILSLTLGCVVALFIFTYLSSQSPPNSPSNNQSWVVGFLPLLGGGILYILLLTNTVSAELRLVFSYISLILFALGTVLTPVLLLPSRWKNLLLWLLPGIGLGITIHFILAQQPIPAVLCLVLTVVICLSLVARIFLIRFFSQISRSWDNRQEKLADYLANVIGSQAEFWIWELTSPFKRKYYQSLINNCQDYRTQGLKIKGAFTLDLEKVFVPLKISSESPEKISPDIIQTRSTIENQTIWDFLVKTKDIPAYKTMAIIAPPGAGKTTLLEHLTLTYAKNVQRLQHPQAPKLIPILLYLRDVEKSIANQQQLPNLVEVILQQEDIKKLNLSPFQNSPQNPTPNPSRVWFEKILNREQCLVMLDGLDEVADSQQRSTVSKWVNQQIENYPKAIFILTSRPFGYKSAPIDKVKSVVEIKPFNLEQMQLFIGNWYLQQEILSRPGSDAISDSRNRAKQVAERQSNDLTARIKNSPPLAAMALNPLLLTMIATVHCFRGALPGRRVELYGEICDVLLGRRQEAKGISDSLTAEQKKAVLQVLALELMKHNTRNFTPIEGINLIENKLATVVSNIQPKDFLIDIKNTSGLLLEKEANKYEFAHKSFQEYLAAVEIQKSTQENILTANINNPWWDETIRLYAAQNDATNLIRAALDNPTVVSLKLALDCQEEGLAVEEKVRQQLADKIDAGLESNEAEIFKLAAEVHLARRLSNFLRIDEDLEIDNSYITCAEYQLYLDSQSNNQKRRFSPGKAKHTIYGVNFTEANKFCAWLMQNNNQQQSLEETICYRLPTEAELQQYPIRDDQQLSGNGIRLVRFKLPPLYAKLCYHLAAGEWKEADLQTLRVMLQVAGKEEQGYLNIRAIENLPCRDLRIIDQLWVQYSNGRFGFSVQKRIWLEVGGRRNSTYGTYEKFGDRVGWKKDGKWERYEDLSINFSNQSSIGHLPVGVKYGVVGREGQGIRYSSLAQRLVDCNI